MIIVEVLESLIWRIRRAWGLLSLYWGTEDCDWAVAASLFRYQLWRIHEHVKEHNIVTGSDRICREIAITVELLDRITGDRAYDIADDRYPGGGKHWADMISAIESQQSEMLATMLRRHLQCWWD